MNTEATETLNWQDVVSGWSFTCGGEAPPEGLAESVVPSVSRSNDGLFEITTISFVFTGTAPYNQQKFTAAFSFSVSGAANFYEVSVSSDDTATVRLGGNDFVSSRLNVPGVASSVWNETASTLPAVSGTFETIGGPYSLSVTITLKRLVGAEWTVSETWTESGPYEIKTATLSFSGTARSDTLGFSWNSLPVEIDGGSWVEISVEADDEATISVGGHSVTATLNNPATYNSDWMEEAPSTFPLLVSYRNTGGPYRLSVTVTVKRSLREVYFEAVLNTPDELSHTPEYSDDEKKEKRKARTVFGLVEPVYVQTRNKIKKTELSPPDTWDGDGLFYNGKICAATNLLPQNKEQERACSLYAIFNDGEEIPLTFTIKYPTHETAKEITEEEFVSILRAANTPEAEISQRLINYEGYPYHDGHYYLVTVHPTDVSFAYLYFWENEYPETKTGLFLEEGLNTVHVPSSPNQLDSRNQWMDCASYAVRLSDDVIANATEDENGDVGVLIWTCPIRWKVDMPNKESWAPNTSIIADGALADRVQRMRFRRPLSPPLLLSVHVSKEFNIGKIS